jgi:nucleoside-diphosphate-sugar epimerase
LNGNSIKFGMKILLLGKNGNLGRGIFQAFKQGSEYNLIAPSKKELDLTNKFDTLKYITEIKPFAIINSASYTTNKNTSIDEAIKISETNLNVSDILQLAARKCNVNTYIDIGSASIYENFPNQVITEKDFRSIIDFMPILPYAKSKLIQTQKTIMQVETDTTWISLILPYVISFNMTGLKETSGLFARISKQIGQHEFGDSKLKLLETYDLDIKRQFVHSIDVGNFCKYLLVNKAMFGLIHLPKLQQMSINDFIQKHYEKLSRKTFESFSNTSIKTQHPVLGSIWDNSSKFNYAFTTERCVELLQSN